MDRRAYVEAKFGGAERAARIYDRVRAAGATVGIPFAFERIARQPNTLAAHRLISWAQGKAARTRWSSACSARTSSRAGTSATARSSRRSPAKRGSIARPRARFSPPDDGDDAVAAMDRRARELGIDGVPFFIFGQRDRRVGRAGAGNAARRDPREPLGRRRDSGPRNDRIDPA